MTRLGGVPISVSIPPILLANATGISKRLAFILALVARLTTTGIMRATVPVLLTNAPITDVTTITVINRRVSFVPAKRTILLPSFWARPVCNTAPPTTNNPTIIITTGFEKPANASSGVRIPKINNKTRPPNATRSERTLPMANNIADTTRIIIVIIICIILCKRIKLCTEL